METREIKPCPWCGSEGRAVRTKDNSQYWYCECSKCYARQLAYSKDMGEAIDRWNNRISGSDVAIESAKMADYLGRVLRNSGKESEAVVAEYIADEIMFIETYSKK